MYHPAFFIPRIIGVGPEIFPSNHTNLELKALGTPTDTVLLSAVS